MKTGFSFFSGRMVVDINFELVINTGFHSDLLNRSSEKFIEMERNITSKASNGYLEVDSVTLRSAILK